MVVNVPVKNETSHDKNSTLTDGDEGDDHRFQIERGVQQEFNAEVQTSQAQTQPFASMEKLRLKRCAHPLTSRVTVGRLGNNLAYPWCLSFKGQEYSVWGPQLCQPWDSPGLRFSTPTQSTPSLASDS